MPVYMIANSLRIPYYNANFFLLLLKGLAESASFLPTGTAVGRFSLDNSALATKGTGLASQYRRLGSAFLLDFQVFFRGDGDTTVGGVANHLTDYFRDLLLQLIDKLLWVVFLRLDVTQLLLPDTRQLSTLQEFLTNQIYQFDTRRRGQQVLAFLADIMALKQRLDDSSTR